MTCIVLEAKKIGKSDLFRLPNIGPATLEDLTRLGITSIEELKRRDPQELYDRICSIDGTKHDICVLDVFTAVIDNAKTGEAKPWWEYSRLRRKLQS